MRDEDEESDLGEVSNHMTSSGIAFGHDVEQEGLDVVVESLVIQEEFGK